MNYLDENEFQRLKREDPGALWVRLRGIALNAVSSFTDLDDEEKSDAFMEGFGKFFLNLSSGRTAKEVCAYIVRGTKWNAMDIRKKKRRWNALFKSCETVSAGMPETQRPSDWEAYASIEEFTRVEWCRDLRRLFHELELHFVGREKVIWKYLAVDHLSVDEIAARLGKSPNVIAVAKSRLLDKARKILSQLDGHSV